MQEQKVPNNLRIWFWHLSKHLGHEFHGLEIHRFLVIINFCQHSWILLVLRRLDCFVHLGLLLYQKDSLGGSLVHFLLWRRGLHGMNYLAIFVVKWHTGLPPTIDFLPQQLFVFPDISPPTSVVPAWFGAIAVVSPIITSFLGTVELNPSKNGITLILSTGGRLARFAILSWGSTLAR